MTNVIVLFNKAFSRLNDFQVLISYYSDNDQSGCRACMATRAAATSVAVEEMTAPVAATADAELK